MSPAAVPGRVRAARPLTEAQRAVLAADLAADPAWVAKWVRAVVPRALVAAFGLDECVSRAHALLVAAASTWNPDDGRATFRTFGAIAIKLGLASRLHLALRADPVWREMPVTPDGRALAEALPDHRGPAAPESALAVWCEPRYRGLRVAALSWRERVLMYLRYVEHWTRDEVAALLGAPPRRVRRADKYARTKIARGLALTRSRP